MPSGSRGGGVWRGFRQLSPPAREGPVPGAHAPVRPGHVGTFLRARQTAVTSLESSKFVLKFLKHSYIFPVTALPKICPQGTKITDIIRGFA